MRSPSGFLRLPRRWRSIDRTLPLLASGLVVLTAAVLAWTAQLLLHRSLVEANGQRLYQSARAAAQLIGRPGVRGTRPVDAASRGIDHTLRAYLAGDATRAEALSAVATPFSATDSSKVWGGLLDTAGNVLLEYRHPAFEAPAWPRAAVASREIRSDTASLGPFERLGGHPAYTTARALLDTATGRPIGYFAETRTMRGLRLGFRRIVGARAQLYVGQPGRGVWSDFENVVSAPAVIATATDSILEFEGGVGAWTPLPGTPWIVAITQPMDAVLAPARALWWSVIPIGLAIALAAAALMWRMALRITHPIVELTEAAETIARDTRAMPATDEIPSEIAGADEVTRLRYAFERMADRVEERAQLEEQLRHAQKMDAVGRLAGGIAHDFNNLLTAIRSYADLMLDDMPAWDPKRSDLHEIRGAAQRAAALTAQLLAFSRKTLLQPRVLDTRSVITEIHGMLRRLMVEDIRLEIEVTENVWPVKADRGQLEQVIVNLAINSRDAMPAGGTLRILAENRRVEEPCETTLGTMPPGEYVALSVADTGVGMDDGVQSRAFEPFFTTKGVGQGTGLGLATVHGIVAQSGGYVTLVSRVGAGTTITVYLPRALEAPDEEPLPKSQPRQGHNETILLVEDEPAVRSLARRVLVRAGYRVLEASTPSDALRLAELHAPEIRLVLSDVVMPEMSGPALAERIGQMVPSSRVLFISGYTDDEVIGRGLGSPDMQLLQKPFSAQQLVERVRAALHA